MIANSAAETSKLVEARRVELGFDVEEAKAVGGSNALRVARYAALAKARLSPP
jgi:hypothetical protein